MTARRVCKGGEALPDPGQVPPAHEYDLQQRKTAEQLQAAVSQQYASNFSAVSNVQDEIQDPTASEPPTEPLTYQQQQNMVQSNQRNKDLAGVTHD